MLLLIDNYDSFTYNLFHYLGQLGAEVVVKRNDEISAAEAIAMKPEAVVLSPGPCTPNEAGICLELIAKANGNAADPGRLPGPSGHRPGLWRQGRARAGADARQAVAHPSHGQERVSRPQQRFPGYALSLADHRARKHARRSGSHGRDATTASSWA